MDFRESFFDVVFDVKSPVHDFMMSVSKNHMEAQLPGEKYAKLREQLQPHYAVGCKRVIITDDYFPTFTRPNVLLETTPIQEITSNGIKIEGGKEHEFDLLVLATGFKTTQFMFPIKIYGSNGKSIEDIWSTGASAYLGMTVPTLPNFSMLYGPNTNLGHNSIILMIEAQALYINTLISKVKGAKSKGGKLRVEPKTTVVERYNREIQSRLAESAFADRNCNSWYKNEAGLITNNWADAVIPYQKRTSYINWNDYNITGPGAAEVKAEGTTKWARVVEETQVSNTALLAGLLTTAGAVAAGALYRNSLKAMLRN